MMSDFIFWLTIISLLLYRIIGFWLQYRKFRLREKVIGLISQIEYSYIEDGDMYCTIYSTFEYNGIAYQIIDTVPDKLLKHDEHESVTIYLNTENPSESTINEAFSISEFLVDLVLQAIVVMSVILFRYYKSR